MRTGCQINIVSNVLTWNSLGGNTGTSEVMLKFTTFSHVAQKSLKQMISAHICHICQGIFLGASRFNFEQGCTGYLTVRCTSCQSSVSSSHPGYCWWGVNRQLWLNRTWWLNCHSSVPSVKLWALLCLLKWPVNRCPHFILHITARCANCTGRFESLSVLKSFSVF